MDIEKIKEDLSICYLKTIAAVRGIAVERIEHDEDSVDVVIKKVLNIDKNVSFNSQISVQLKATSSKSQYSIGKQEISYKLKVKNYNDLAPIFLEDPIHKPYGIKKKLLYGKK